MRSDKTRDLVLSARNQCSTEVLLKMPLSFNNRFLKFSSCYPFLPTVHCGWHFPVCQAILVLKSYYSHSKYQKMKKTLLALTLVQIGYCAFPQNSSNNRSSENGWASAAPSVRSSKHSSTAAADVAIARAVKNFKETFKNVRNEKWYSMQEGYRANFTLNGIRYRLDYDKNGRWMHTIKYYDEKKLPAEVRRLVASSYLDYNVRSVEEIEVQRTPLFYVIHLEGEKEWINIKVAEYEIYEIEKIKKS
jgi:hypothetical protein